MTFLQLITASFRIAGLLGAPGRGISQEEATEGLEVLNALLDLLKLDRCAVYAIMRTEFNLTANKGDYTIGASGVPDIAAERPVRIDRAGFVFTTSDPNTEIPLDVLNEQQWAAYAPKSATGSTPTMLHYQPTVPNGTIYLRPIPTTSQKIALYLWQTVNEYTSLSGTVTLAPGYRLMLEYNLAVQLAERYPERQKISQTAITRARSSLAEVRRANAPTLLMRCEAAAMGIGDRSRYNILTNSYDPAV